MMSLTTRSTGLLARQSRASVARLFQVTQSSQRACMAKATKVQVVETSLGLGVESKLLRHLGLRFDCDSDEVLVDGEDFSEAHFGPGSGAFQEGFLKTGKGMVADSEYKEVTNAGTTDKSVEECLEWCKKWSDGKLFVAVGQNCWSMVSEFLTTQGDDLVVPDSVQFREEQVNGWTELFVDAAQKKADKEGVEIGEVWESVMQNPQTIVTELLDSIAPDSINELFPDMDKPGEKVDEAKGAVKDAASNMQDKIESASDDAGSPLRKVQKTVENVKKSVSNVFSDDDSK